MSVSTSRIVLRCLMFLSVLFQIPQVCAALELPAPYAFIVAGDGQYVVHAVTQASTCPLIAWDTQAPIQMAVRVGPAEVGARTTEEDKPANFPVLSCESTWLKGAKQARIGDQILKSPNASPQRIVVLGDTGCRLKAADKAFQACLDPVQWPFANIAKQAASKNPDLVIHVGDIAYRESPCPAEIKGCAGSVWGQGYDVWDADFFQPALPLLTQAPWVFARGNHESCARSGQGWFRFIDYQAWDAQRTCNTVADYEAGDYSVPFAVSIGSEAQIIVFDSSADKKKNSPSSVNFKKYSQQLATVDQLLSAKPFNIFVSHHPLEAVEKSRDTGAPFLFQTGLTHVMSELDKQHAVRQGMSFSLHGHFHTFESISFNDGRAPVIVTGNGGTAIAPSPKTSDVTESLQQQFNVTGFVSRQSYGFLTLDRQNKAGSRWLLTEYDSDGKSIVTCQLNSRKSVCQPV